MKNDTTSKNWISVVANQCIYNISGNIFDYYDSGIE